ncbi:sensor histidine kinase [Brevundimonas nasdae]|uniref:sensor histidine kinase n=1 Tax=Brevundimonas nasdae TaxID=172043 RepID=UPI00289BE353|nr:ATP-binding protein [Brevundimonas nasdae]
MASATATAKADLSGPRPEDETPARRRRFRFGGSRLGGFILSLNLLSLLILFGGALLLNEWRQGLIEARQESLTVQAELLANVLREEGVTRGVPTPELDLERASIWLTDRFIPAGQRVRLYDSNGLLVVDSYQVTEAVSGQPLGAAQAAGTPVADDSRKKARAAAEAEKAEAAIRGEVNAALDGRSVVTVRRNEQGERVVSVTIPVRHVRQVLGALTVEAGNVDEILSAQRRALMPFALVALGVNLLASLMLHLFVARPVMRLSAAADQVKLQRARAISLPDLEDRKDEIGDLARSLESMTDTLSTRMDAIERFAADVSHEIKNPLTSIRSALETLPLVKTDEHREKLTNLLQQDVRRLDRLITDISNASRLDAELSRDRPRAIELNRLLGDIVSVYETTAKPGDIPVQLTQPQDFLRVMGRDGPLGQVFRNLIDNARSFSPPDGVVRVTLEETDGDQPIHIRVEDDGPGIPAENLETVFERFYTSRPKGAAFGSNSGLGLSIVRQIAEAHGGRAWAENRLAEDGRILGARFVIALPAVGKRA